MLSSGGVLPAEEAAAHPARLLVSGPAGGVVGAGLVARRAGFEHAIAFDMGGTSTDVCLLPGGRAVRVPEREVGGLPVRLPTVDVHTVGAGGGSLVRRDAGGAVRVGPESAGADPGPACYGRGGGPTVTDANLLLGRLPEELPGGLVLPPGGEADLRYRGQSFELTVTLGDELAERFHRAHEERYGYAHRGREVELVAVRTAEVVAGPELKLPSGEHERASGPARIELEGSTLWIPPGWEGVRDGSSWVVTRE